MKAISSFIIFFLIGNFLFAQQNDSLFEKRISAFAWLPSGTSIILNVMKIDKTEKTTPLLKKFRFDIKSKTITLLPIDGGGLAVSPNGNLVAYVKRVMEKDHIYLYDFSTKNDMLLWEIRLENMHSIGHLIAKI